VRPDELEGEAAFGDDEPVRALTSSPPSRELDTGRRAGAVAVGLALGRRLALVGGR
jgi:hypothetical protein